MRAGSRYHSICERKLPLPMPTMSRMERTSIHRRSAATCMKSSVTHKSQRRFKTSTSFLIEHAQLRQPRFTWLEAFRGACIETGAPSRPPSQDSALYSAAEGRRPASCIVSCFCLTQTAPCLSDTCLTAMWAGSPLRFIRGTVHQEDKLVHCTRRPGDTYPSGKVAAFKLWNGIAKS